MNLLSGPCRILRFKRTTSTTVMDATRFFPQKVLSRVLTSQNTKRAFKKHRTGSDDDRRMRLNDQNCREEVPRWKIRLEKKTKFERHKEARISERHQEAPQSDPPISDSHQATGPILLQARSPTYQWLSRLPATPIVLPDGVSECSIPDEGNEPGDLKAPVRQLRKHTKEERKKVEVILTTSVPKLAHFVPSDMMEMIKKSPLIPRGKDVLVLRSDNLRTRSRNLKECYKLLTRFLRNVASEIIYREERIAADDEKRHKSEEESLGDSPQ